MQPNSDSQLLLSHQPFERSSVGDEEQESARKEWLQYHLQTSNWAAAEELIVTQDEREDLEYLIERARRTFEEHGVVLRATIDCREFSEVLAEYDDALREREQSECEDADDDCNEEGDDGHCRAPFLEAA